MIMRDGKRYSNAASKRKAAAGTRGQQASRQTCKSTTRNVLIEFPSLYKYYKDGIVTIELLFILRTLYFQASGSCIFMSQAVFQATVVSFSFS
jgi:hypothetical protein